MIHIDGFFMCLGAFETEVESEKKKKEKYISNAKEKGIWNMKFMKSAEDKPRILSVSEMNKVMNGNVNKKDLNLKNKFGFDKKVKVKTQRYYVNKNDENNENCNENDGGNDNNEWKVVLKRNQSVHNITFGTLYPNEWKVEIEMESEKKEKEKCDENMNENLNVFLDESDDTQSESENENIIKKKVIVQSILKHSKHECIGKYNKHVKFGANEYWNGNKINKSVPIEQKEVDINPYAWLSQLNGNNKCNKKEETTQFDANKMLIPNKLRKTPDFNLLNTTDEKQIDIIYKSLQNNNEKAELMDVNTNEKVMYLLFYYMCVVIFSVMNALN